MRAHWYNHSTSLSVDDTHVLPVREDLKSPNVALVTTAPLSPRMSLVMKSHDTAAKHERTTAAIIHPNVMRPHHFLKLVAAIVLLGNQISLSLAQFFQRDRSIVEWEMNDGGWSSLASVGACWCMLYVVH